MNETHDANLMSWIESANNPQTDFSIQNLPFGVFRANGAARVGIAIGDAILDVRAAQRAGLYDGIADEAARVCANDSLFALMQLGSAHWSALRAQTSRLLRADTEQGKRAQNMAAQLLVPMAQAEMLKPLAIGDYTDFTASIYHATNAGSLLHPDNPLAPNYKYVPIGYHGRASSIVLSGTPIRRPRGQIKHPNEPAPTFGLSQRMDYELELAFYIGRANELGEPIAIEDAENYLFGVCLLNDWSARDVQGWEMQPLGPFLGKNFGTLISPWVITMEALAPFRAPAFTRPEGDPPPLPHLFSARDQQNGGLDVTLEIFYATEKMRAENISPARVAATNARYLYWTPAQLLTHHASNGCNMRLGDLFATGTISGPTRDALGSMLELTRGGREPYTLPNGETRKFLDDGDEIIMRAYCERAGFRRIGLGECRGQIIANG